MGQDPKLRDNTTNYEPCNIPRILATVLQYTITNVVNGEIDSWSKLIVMCKSVTTTLQGTQPTSITPSKHCQIVSQEHVAIYVTCLLVMSGFSHIWNVRTQLIEKQQTRKHTKIRPVRVAQFRDERQTDGQTYFCVTVRH